MVYVDDIILAGSHLDDITGVKSYLSDKFKLRDMRVLKYFLGIEVARSKQGIVLSQQKYALEILEDSGFLGAKPTTFHVKYNSTLTRGE